MYTKEAVVLLHGGPGAGGYLGPVAEMLSDEYTVVEPLQPMEGDCSIDRLVEDLSLVLAESSITSCHLIGHSFGAMLALYYGSCFPRQILSIMAVCSGTFCEKSRTILQNNLDDALSLQQKKRLGEHIDGLTEDENLKRKGLILACAGSYELLAEPKMTVVSAQAHQATWNDWLRLESVNVIPQIFTQITSPVMLVHGEADYHPGVVIHATLKAVLPDIHYAAIPRCGHYPWLEKYGEQPFRERVIAWLFQNRAHRP